LSAIDPAAGAAFSGKVRECRADHLPLNAAIFAVACNCMQLQLTGEHHGFK
jgi:hypothetical protein